MEISPQQILKWLNQHKDIVILGGFGCLMILIGIREWHRSEQPPALELIEDENGDGVIGDVLVDISGAVNSPGLYRFEIGSRLGVAIEAAGGFSDKADATWIAKQLNLAKELEDGLKIYIPFSDQLEDSEESTDQDHSNLVPINTASITQLKALPGIGEVRAQSIIDNRPYNSKQDLIDTAGLSQKLADDLEPLIRFY